MNVSVFELYTFMISDDLLLNKKLFYIGAVRLARFLVGKVTLNGRILD